MVVTRNINYSAQKRLVFAKLLPDPPTPTPRAHIKQPNSFRKLQSQRKSSVVMKLRSSNFLLLLGYLLLILNGTVVRPDSFRSIPKGYIIALSQMFELFSKPTRKHWMLYCRSVMPQRPSRTSEI